MFKLHIEIWKQVNFSVDNFNSRYILLAFISRCTVDELDIWEMQMIEVPFNSRRSGQINKYIWNITRTMINTNITNKLDMRFEINYLLYMNLFKQVCTNEKHTTAICSLRKHTDEICAYVRVNVYKSMTTLLEPFKQHTQSKNI